MLLELITELESVVSLVLICTNALHILKPRVSYISMYKRSPRHDTGCTGMTALVIYCIYKPKQIRPLRGVESARLVFVVAASGQNGSRQLYTCTHICFGSPTTGLHCCLRETRKHTLG